VDKKSGCVQPSELRKSFVRKVSINLSVRKSNSKPIRKISDAMKKMFPMPKSLKSLANSQINSDSWEYLAECGINPVYEEVQEIKDSEENIKESLNKSAMRCLSCDSLYQSDNSNSNASSMSRGIPEELPSMEIPSGDYWSERITNTSLTPSGRNTSESSDSSKLKSSSSIESADYKSQKSSSSGEKRGRANNKPLKHKANSVVGESCVRHREGCVRANIAQTERIR
jgi:hypothetical protein